MSESAAHLLERLQHGDRHVRDETFDRIAASRDPELLAPLAQRAQPADPYMELLFSRFLQNVPAASTLLHLGGLLRSPNASTRAHALSTLDGIDFEQRFELLLELLGSEYQDVQLHALGVLGTHKRSAAIHGIAPLLTSPDEEVATAAFTSLQQIDAPRSLRLMLPFLRSSEPARQIAALNALGSMASFRRWKRLLSCLRSPDSEVRRAAVLNLSRKAGRKAYKHLIPLLETEPDEEVAKLIINRMALAPDDRVARVLIPTAATHPNPQIRRSAAWVIEEMDEDLLGRHMQHLLPRSSEEVQAYILTKMGQRQLPGCGPILASYAGEDRPARLRYAAFEGLGFLQQREFLPVVLPYLQSEDPMAAYVATLTAVQLVDRLGDCPELIDLLLSTHAESTVLKQVVLQFMIDALAWDFDDSRLFEVLVSCVRSENENVSYLATILLGKCRGRRELVQPLLEQALDGPSADIRQVARESLDQVLDGDLSCFLDALQEPEFSFAKLCVNARLLAELRWGPDSARRGLEVFDALQCPEEEPDAPQVLGKIARAVYQADPEACRRYFARPAANPRWRRAVGQAWLHSLGRMERPADRSDWHVLFADAELGLDAARQAVAAGADWAVQAMIERIGRCPDDPVSPHLRAAVRELVER